MSTKDLKLALAMLTQNAKSQFEQSQQMMSFQREMMIQAAKAAGLELNLPELPKLEFVISADLQQTIDGAEKSATEARAELFAKRINEAITAQDLERLSAVAGESTEARAQAELVAGTIKDLKAKIDLLKAELERSKDRHEELENAASNSAASIVLLDVARRVDSKEYQQYAISFTGDLKTPAKARTPKAPSKKATPKATGENPTVGSASNGFGFAFPDGTKVEGQYKELMADKKVQELATKGITNWKSITGTAGGEVLRRITWRDNKYFPSAVSLKNDKGETFARVYMLNSGTVL